MLNKQPKCNCAEAYRLTQCNATKNTQACNILNEDAVFPVSSTVSTNGETCDYCGYYLWQISPLAEGLPGKRKTQSQLYGHRVECETGAFAKLSGMGKHYNG